MQVDLHIHSTASDGTWTPPEVVAAVPACGSVRMVRRSSKIKKRISIWINVLAADVVSVPVRRTR